MVAERRSDAPKKSPAPIVIPRRGHREADEPGLDARAGLAARRQRRRQAAEATSLGWFGSAQGSSSLRLLEAFTQRPPRFVGSAKRTFRHFRREEHGLGGQCAGSSS